MPSPAPSTPPSAPLRVVTFDILRGIAIGTMVFLHNGVFHAQNVGALLADPPPWLILFGFLLLWAGLFGVVSGAANAATTMRRLERHATQGGPWRYPASLLRGAVQTFLIVFALHWAWTLVVGNSGVTASADDPALRVTMIPGLMYYGFVPRIHPENWIFASALWMIASNVLLVSLSLRWFYRETPPRPDDSVIRFLLVVAIVVLVATPLLRAWLFPPMMTWDHRGGLWIAAAVPLALLINDPNPVFPFFAYGLLGAIVGISLARAEPRRLLYRRMLAGGAVLLVAGGVGLAVSGGLVLVEREEIWGQSPLYFSSLAYLLLGIFSWLIAGLLAIFDPAPESGRTPWRPGWLRALVRFGRLSLTIFLLEGILAMALRIGLDHLAPGWNAALGNVLVFAAANLLLWHLLLVAWERVGFRGSMEWCLARLRKNEDRARALTEGNR